VKHVAEQDTAARIDWERRLKVYVEGGLILLSKRLKKKRAPKDVDETDEITSSLTADITLKCHTDGVVSKARVFAEHCVFEGASVRAVVEATELHDVGKCDKRFQDLLNPMWDRDKGPLAKGDGGGIDRKTRQRDSGYPKGARHEFGSVALAAKRASWPEGCDPELILHLIGTHHGYGRALAPIWPDEDYEVRAKVYGKEVAVSGVHRLAHLKSGWTDRYWAMTRKYGWWGLAYLEAIVRRADCVRSREEEEERS